MADVSDAQFPRTGPADHPERYELIERRAAGGEGEVWKAREYHDGQPFHYAVKIIDDDGDRAGARLNALRMQAALATHLEHPALVKVREVFLGAEGADGVRAGSRRLYFVMKWIEGPSLQEVLDRGDLRGLDVLTVLEPIADALDYLHSGRDTNGAPVLHRDVKPANILLAGDGRVYLVDFGLVRLRSTDSTARIYGTPPFMAPESTVRGEFTPATDRYALGATVYYVLTGEFPVPGSEETMRERLGQVLGQGADRVVQGVLAMLSGMPDRRPPSAGSWIRGLRNAPPETVTGPRPASSTAPFPMPPTHVPARTGSVPPVTHVPGGPAQVYVSGAPLPPPGYPPTGAAMGGAPPRSGPTGGGHYPLPPQFAGGVSTFPGGPPFPGGPVPRRSGTSAGKVTAIIVGAVVAVLLLVCGLPVVLSVFDGDQRGGDGTAGSSAGPSVNRATPPPSTADLEKALLSVGDVSTTLKISPDDVREAGTHDAGRYIKGGLNQLNLCTGKPMPSSAIGSSANNYYALKLGALDWPRIASSVAGFYGEYAKEYFAALRPHAERCGGWQEFQVPGVGDEAFGLYNPKGDSAYGEVAMVFARSGRLVVQIGYDVGGRGQYQSELIKMCTGMVSRAPKGGS